MPKNHVLKRLNTAFLAGLLLLGPTTASHSQSTEDESLENSTKNAAALKAQKRLGELVKMISPDAVGNESSWQFTVASRQLFVVTDANADRMRIMSPIMQADNLDAALLERMLQANYDAVLDSRYALAQNIVWSVFIHPLTSLTEKDFLSGTAQTVTAAQTFGTTFSSGVFVYGGGDSNGIHQRLMEELQKSISPSM